MSFLEKKPSVKYLCGPCVCVVTIAAFLPSDPPVPVSHKVSAALVIAGYGKPQG